MSASFFEAMAC